MAIIVKNEPELLALGASLAQHIQAPWVLFLRGELGAGKTTLVRGFLRGLGYQGTVKSPTYTLVEPYNVGGRTVFHFDLYRLGSPRELAEMGIRDYFAADAICLIEWPERAEGVLPQPDGECWIEILGEERRLELSLPFNL